MAMAVVYDTLGGMLLSEKRGATVTEYVSDPLGSLKTCNDLTGSVTYTAAYWPYGELRSTTGSNPSPWGFVGLLGYLTDTATRIYVRMRHYMSKLTRWLTVDPIWPKEPAYLYSRLMPMQLTDATGLGVCETWAYTCMMATLVAMLILLLICIACLAVCFFLFAPICFACLVACIPAQFCEWPGLLVLTGCLAGYLACQFDPNKRKWSVS